MKFLAWDIGIKNLAYNIIEYTEEHPYKIHHWEIINLVDDTEANKLLETCVQKIICCGFLKSGKECQQKACFIEKEDMYKGYCNKHVKDKNIEELIMIKAKMNCVHHIIKKKELFPCKKIGYWRKTDNPYIVYCPTHIKTINKTKPEEQYYLDPKKASKVKQFNIKELATKLFTELDKRPHLLDVTHVIIENQPVFKNPTMKSIQIMVYSYFIMKGIMTQKVDNISCFMAGKKLDAFTGNKEIATKLFGHIKSEYKQTKNSAVLFCLEMLKDNYSEWHQFLSKQPKKDDLADAYLTNFHYIHNTYLKTKNNIL